MISARTVPVSAIAPLLVGLALGCSTEDSAGVPTVESGGSAGGAGTDVVSGGGSSGTGGGASGAGGVPCRGDAAVGGGGEAPTVRRATLVWSMVPTIPRSPS